MARRFYTLDVFTDTALAGNPLAVVLDANGLTDGAMQGIAREFNLSETVFVFEPDHPKNTARVRIFTPTRELPFAGHPTVGTAALLASLQAPERLATKDQRIVLEEKIGEVVCVARRRSTGAMEATFDLAKLPERLGAAIPTLTEIASGLGRAPSDIGFDRHEPSLFSAGVPYLFVPVRSLDAVRRARALSTPWNTEEGPGTFVYAREVVDQGSSFHARMFAPGWGVAEDPATGSAAAAFAGVAIAFDRLRDGEHRLIIEQGYEMSRPSLIALGLRIEGGALRSASIGGAAVIVSSGALEL